MKNILLVPFILSAGITLAQPQYDSIFTNSGALVVSIREITEDAVKFSYPREELINSIYKNTVFKIVHKSGRIEKFAEQTSFKLVTNGADWENVSITGVENEIKGLFKLEEVSAKATGATAFSNVNTVKDRAFKKLKIEAAMCGANMIFMLDQQSKGVSSTFGGSDPARTNLTGICYSNRRPNFTEFQKIMSSKSEFKYIEYQSLGHNSTDLYSSIDVYQPNVKITSVREENGFIMIKANMLDEDPKEYRVTYFDETKIVFMAQSRNKIQNYILKR